MLVVPIILLTLSFFFFNDTATTEIYTLSLHDALPIWEEDSYRRWSRVPWGGTTLLYPFGPPGVGQRRVVWVEITVSRGFAAGETRASEEVTIIDSAVAFRAPAVIPPRRVMGRMTRGRGDTA